MNLERLARAAYEEYGCYVGWKNVAGKRMPAWDALPLKIRNAWASAVGAAFSAATTDD